MHKALSKLHISMQQPAQDRCVPQPENKPPHLHPGRAPPTPTPRLALLSALTLTHTCCVRKAVWPRHSGLKPGFQC